LATLSADDGAGVVDDGGGVVAVESPPSPPFPPPVPVVGDGAGVDVSVVRSVTADTYVTARASTSEINRMERIVADFT